MDHYALLLYWNANQVSEPTTSSLTSRTTFTALHSLPYLWFVQSKRKPKCHLSGLPDARISYETTNRVALHPITTPKYDLREWTHHHHVFRSRDSRGCFYTSGGFYKKTESVNFTGGWSWARSWCIVVAVVQMWTHDQTGNALLCVLSCFALYVYQWANVTYTAFSERENQQ